MRSYQYNCLKKSLQQRGEIAAFITTIGLVALTATLLIANSLVKSRNAIRTSAQSVPTVTIVNPAHLSFINPGSYTIKWTTSGTNFFPDSGMLIMDDQNSPQKPTCDIYNPGSPSGESCVYLSSQQQVNWYFPPSSNNIMGIRYTMTFILNDTNYGTTAQASSSFGVNYPSPTPTFTPTPTKTPTPSCPPGTFVTLTNLPTDRKIEAKPYTLTWSDIPSTTNVKYRIVVTDGPNTLVNHLTQDISQKSYTVDFTGKAGKTYSIEVYGVNACGFGAIGAGGMATVDIVAIAATATPTKTPTLTRTPTPTSTPTPKPCTSDVQCTPPNVCDLVTKKCTIPPNPGPCPKKKEGDADCKNNTAGNPVNLADFEIWRNEYNNDCSKQNLTTVRCFRDEDGDGSLMDANFDYPGSNSGYTDEAVRIPDFEIWRKGYYKYGI